MTLPITEAMLLVALHHCCVNELHLYVIHCKSAVTLVGLYGIGARQERGLLERHDDHH